MYLFSLLITAVTHIISLDFFDPDINLTFDLFALCE
jgi:hypothetical protein